MAKLALPPVFALGSPRFGRFGGAYFCWAVARPGGLTGDNGVHELTIQGGKCMNDTMNEHELKKIAMERYTDLQRIKKYGQKELEYQEKILKAELQMLGISTEELELND